MASSGKEWTTHRKQLWGMSDGEAPLPLGKQGESRFEDKESKMIDSIVERVYSKGRKLSSAFAEFDVGRTGKLNVDQLATAMQRWGLNYTDTELGGLLNKYSDDGYIDYKQFNRMLLKQPPVADDDVRSYETPRSPFAQHDAAPMSRPATAPRDASIAKGDSALKTKIDEALYSYLGEKNLTFTDAVRALFAFCDKSRKGWLSYADFKRGLPAALNVDISDTDFNRLIGKVDVKSEGRIDFPAFVAFMAPSDVEQPFDQEDVPPPSVASAVPARMVDAASPATDRRRRDSNPITGEGVRAPTASTGKRFIIREARSNPITGQ